MYIFKINFTTIKYRVFLSTFTYLHSQQHLSSSCILNCRILQGYAHIDSGGSDALEAHFNIESFNFKSIRLISHVPTNTGMGITLFSIFYEIS